MTTLAGSGELTPELGEYLELAYVSLADYVDDEVATLLREYARAGQELCRGQPGWRARKSRPTHGAASRNRAGSRVSSPARSARKQMG